jgi:hypothetical protein
MNTAAPALKAFIGSLAVAAALAATASSASAAIVINEVESDGVADYVELTNTGVAPVNIGNYVIKDSDDGHAFIVPPVTMLDPGQFYTAYVDGPGGFGLGSGDSARVFEPAAVDPIATYSWTSHAAATYGRCPDGTGPMKSTLSATPGAANDCPVAASPWPGGAAVATADGLNVFGSNLSGLAYQPSGTAAPGVLWAVRNGPSTLYRLIWDGSKWTPDTANGWANGKSLVFPNGAGVPDAEGVTLAGGDANGVYVSIERNDDGPNSNTSRPGVLRFDVAAAGTTLTATREWGMAADLPGLGANAGLEAITWIPDSVLVQKGFVDDGMGAAYDPKNYPEHGDGLFFVGVEQDGRILAYALNKTGGQTKVATISSHFPKLKDHSFEPERGLLWAVSDDGCDGRTATLDVAKSGPNAGYFVVADTFERPAGMPNLNNEGFTIAPQAECVNGHKPVFYADDSNTGGHALRAGTRDCKPLAQPPVVPTPTPTPGNGGGGSSQQPQVNNTPQAPAQPSADRTAPKLAVAVKVTTSGTFAVRRTGKLRLSLTLGEKSDLTITAKAKSRSILKLTRKGVSAGKPTFTLRITRKARTSLRKGNTLTVTVQARDAAGNTTTRTAKAKVR